MNLQKPCVSSPAIIRRANRSARLADQSHLWPVNSRFNVTERAIRRLKNARRHCNAAFDNYPAALDAEISHLVNLAV